SPTPRSTSPTRCGPTSARAICWKRLPSTRSATGATARLPARRSVSAAPSPPSVSVRVLSGAVLIALVGATIWVLPSWATLILAAVVAAIGAREVCGLAAALGARTSSWFVALASAAICASLGLAPHVLVPSFSHFLLAAIAALIVAAGAVVIFTAPPSKENFAGALAALAAPIYVGFPLGLLALVQAGGTPGRAEVSWLIG